MPTSSSPYYGAYFAILPVDPTPGAIPPSVLLEACRRVSDPDFVVVALEEEVEEVQVPSPLLGGGRDGPGQDGQSTRKDMGQREEDHHDEDRPGEDKGEGALYPLPNNHLRLPIQWTFHRTSELRHPQLSRPLQFLEISGLVQDEAVCQQLAHALEQLFPKEVGSAELLLVLEATVIPVLSADLSMDGSTASLDRCGVVGIRNTSSSSSHSAYTAALDQVLEHAVKWFETLYSRLVELQTRPSSPQSSTKFRYREIMQRDKYRFDFVLDDTLSNDGVNREDNDAGASSVCCWDTLEREGKWMDLIHEALGDDAVRVKVGCVLSLPGALEQYWHSDGEHRRSSKGEQGPEMGPGGARNDPPTVLCVFVPLVQLTEETGCTEFWSGSHRYDRLLAKKGEHALPGGTMGLVERGDAVAYDYRIVHRGTANRSDRARPIAYYLYARRGCESVEDRNFVPRSIWE